MDSITFDLCVLLRNPKKKEVLLYFLEKAHVEIICYSYLDRRMTKQALSSAGLLSYIDDIHYGPVPCRLVNQPSINLRSILPRAKWPLFMRLLP